MHHLARFSLSRRALTALITAAIAVLGVVSLTSLRQELIPSINLPAAVVIGAYPGASPEVVEDRVTTVIEDAVAGVDGIEEMTSTAASNVSTTTVMFEYGTDMPTALADLRGALDAASNLLPEDVDPQTIAGSIDDLPVIQLAVSGGENADDLANVVEQIITPELEDIEGARSVTVSGQAVRQITIDVDMAALLGAELTPDQVLNILDDYGVRIPGGTLTDGEESLTVEIGTPLTSADDLAAIPMGTTPDGAEITLGDIAEVVDGEAEPTSFSRLNGETSLSIAITKTPDGNVVEISDATQQVIDDLAERLEAQDVQVAVTFDQAPFITESIEGLATEGLLGLVFAIIVILLFLLSVRSTLVSAVSIPLSLLTAFVVMEAVGYTLNLLTLAALTISIGRVVDDAIVVIENIKRHFSYGEGTKAAVIVTAVKEVAGAITSATIATVAVFAPIGFVGGFVGELFRPFALTVAIGMLASLFVSLTIIPVLAYWFLKVPASAEAAQAAQSRREEAEAKERRGLWQRAYLPLLRASLRRPVVTLVIAVAVLGGTLALVPQLQTNFLGNTGQNTLTVTQQFQPGTSLQAQDDAATEVEEALLEIDEIDTVQSSVGGGGPLAFFGGGGEQATFAITLDPDADAEAIETQVRTVVEPMVTDRVTGISVAGGDAGLGSTTVDLIVTADEIDVLTEAGTQVYEAVEGTDGVAELSTSLAADQPVIQVTVDKTAAAAAGLSETEVAGAVAGAMSDAEVGTIDIDGAEVSVVASFAQAPADLDELESLPLGGAAGPVPLSEVAEIEVVQTASEITRTDGRRTITISVTPDIADLGSLTAELTDLVDGLELPGGAEVEIGGAASQQADAFADLGLALVLAIAIIYIVLVATFNSLTQPLILLVSVPFAATGALVGLLVTDTPLGVPSLIGALMLVGVVVSNAIVLIDLINQYRARGRSLTDAVVEGARKRLRPIVMTAAATIFALLPMSLGITGGGAFISQPLAIVVIGGLLTSTLLTLIVVPVIYTLGQRWAQRRRERRGEVDPVLDGDSAPSGSDERPGDESLAADDASAGDAETDDGADPAPEQTGRRRARHAADLPPV